MKSIKRFLVAISLLAVSATASAVTTTLSTTGTLPSDDSLALIGFTVDTTSLVSAETFSFAGGTQADGNVVAAGGFDPILTLFSSTGAVLAQNDDGTSLDSFLSILLAGGNYIIGVSQFSYFPTSLFGGGTSSNTSIAGGFSNADYAFDITISTVPVPAAGILFASALFGAGFMGRRKKKATKSNMVGAFARTA